MHQPCTKENGNTFTALSSTKTSSPGWQKLSGQGRITGKVINSLQDYFGSAIRSSATLDDMRNACWATFFHKSSTDANPQHGLCPVGADSWCKYNRKAAIGPAMKAALPEHDNILPPYASNKVHIQWPLCTKPVKKMPSQKKLRTVTKLLTISFRTVSQKLNSSMLKLYKLGY